MFPTLETGTCWFTAERRSPRKAERAGKARITDVEVSARDLEGALSAADVVEPATGEVLVEANAEVTLDILASLQEAKIKVSVCSFRNGMMWASC